MYISLPLHMCIHTYERGMIIEGTYHNEITIPSFQTLDLHSHLCTDTTYDIYTTLYCIIVHIIEAKRKKRRRKKKQTIAGGYPS